MDRRFLWTNANPASCAAEGCFCEEPREEPIRQPANTWSNLAFILAAVLILRAKGKGAALYAGIVASIGLGSMAFHASLTFAGEWLDNAAMYLFTSHLTFLSLRRLEIWNPAVYPLLTIAMTSLLAAGAYFHPERRRWFFAVSVLSAIASEYYSRRHHPLSETKWFRAGAGCFVLAYVFWWLDLYGVVCSPRSWFQGHALWHILSAAATYALYRHYRTFDASRGGGLF